jgi:hypothetical protein
MQQGYIFYMFALALLAGDLASAQTGGEPAQLRSPREPADDAYERASAIRYISCCWARESVSAGLPVMISWHGSYQSTLPQQIQRRALLA